MLACLQLALRDINGDAILVAWSLQSAVFAVDSLEMLYTSVNVHVVP